MEKGALLLKRSLFTRCRRTEAPPRSDPPRRASGYPLKGFAQKNTVGSFLIGMRIRPKPSLCVSASSEKHISTSRSAVPHGRNPHFFHLRPGRMRSLREQPHAEGIGEPAEMADEAFPEFNALEHIIDWNVTSPRPILRIGRGFSFLRSQPGCLRDLHDLSEHLERTFLSAGRVAPPPSVF